MAAGNTVTCSMQGFISIVMFIILEIAYTILSVLYWIMIAYGWTERKTQRRKIRFFFLGLPIVIAVGFATPPLFLQMYNFSGAYSCSIGEYPLDCDTDSDTVCERGTRNARNWTAALLMGVLICTVIIIVSMSLLVKNVRIQERKNDRYLSEGQTKRREMTRKTFWQAIRYILVFFISNLPFYIYAVIDVIRVIPPYEIAIIYATVWPMFGVLNSFAYFRPRYLSYRERNKDKLMLQCLLAVVEIDLRCWCSRSDENIPPNINQVIEDGDLNNPLFQEESSIHQNTAV